MYNVTGAVIKKAAIRHYLKGERLILMKFSGKISLGKSLLEPVNIVEPHQVARNVTQKIDMLQIFKTES